MSARPRDHPAMLAAPAAAHAHRIDNPIGLLDCPAWPDANRPSSCGLPAEVRSRYIAESTDGPVDCAVIWCPAGHFFNGPIECLAP
jgi:hypothetical protein